MTFQNKETILLLFYCSISLKHCYLMTLKTISGTKTWLWYFSKDSPLNSGLLFYSGYSFQHAEIS